MRVSIAALEVSVFLIHGKSPVFIIMWYYTLLYWDFVKYRVLFLGTVIKIKFCGSIFLNTPCIEVMVPEAALGRRSPAGTEHQNKEGYYERIKNFLYKIVCFCKSVLE